MPLVNAAGATPDEFPATLSALRHLDDDDVSKLLEFYGL
jgi:hypothetical protein